MNLRHCGRRLLDGVGVRRTLSGNGLAGRAGCVGYGMSRSGGGRDGFVHRVIAAVATTAATGGGWIGGSGGASGGSTGRRRAGVAGGLLLAGHESVHTSHPHTSHLVTGGLLLRSPLLHLGLEIGTDRYRALGLLAIIGVAGTEADEEIARGTLARRSVLTASGMTQQLLHLDAVLLGAHWVLALTGVYQVLIATFEELVASLDSVGRIGSALVIDCEAHLLHGVVVGDLCVACQTEVVVLATQHNIKY